MPKVWLVTGSASGLGRNIAEAVLASGDRLIATARDPRRLEDLVKKYGDQVRTAALDVVDESAAQAAVHMAVAVIFGVAAGSITALLVITRVMDFSFVWMALPAAATALVALLATVVLGLAGTFAALGHKPAEVLRNL